MSITLTDLVRNVHSGITLTRKPSCAPKLVISVPPGTRKPAPASLVIQAMVPQSREFVARILSLKLDQETENVI